ncbi:MAG: pyrroloquinoline quinone-dependent dehydrogenase [Bauldia sp.]
MSGGLKVLTAALLGSAVGLLALPSAAQEAPVTQDRLNNADAEPQNWIIPFQNYSSHRYSRLDEINRDTVGDLRVAFTVPLSDTLRGRNLADNEAAPLVDGGFMYIEGHSGFLYKIDMTSGVYGTVVWTANASPAAPGGARTRGAAFYEDSVIMAVQDGRVVRVNRDTGEVVYDVQIARVVDEGHAGIEPQSEQFNMNPLAMENRIIVGNAAGDAGTRGWVQAVDFATGEPMWRFYTVPGPGEFGHETWADPAGVAWRTGGAAIWTGGSYDVAQRLYITGTAQPVPMFDPEYRPGDNLFSNSAIALDIDTGDLAWYFQYTPNESWDYDEQGVHMLIDAPWAGEDRQMVAHFGRNGFFYQLDRTDGTFINGVQYVNEITWTAGLDPKTGLPVEYNPDLELQTYIPETRWARADAAAETACPYLPGGVRWQPPAYNPDTHIAYVGGEDGCQTRVIMPAITLANGEIDEQGRTVPGTGVDTNIGGLLAAVDVTTGQVVGRVFQPYPNRSGALATSGGLVFAAYNDGSLHAFNDETLEELWTFYTGSGIKAPFVSFEINGKQYLAIVAGAQQDNQPALGQRGWTNMLYVFTL